MELHNEVRVILCLLVCMSSKPAGGANAAPVGLMTQERCREDAKEDAL